MQGWIKLHRKIRENPIFNDFQFFRLWMICLTEATHKEREQIIGKNTVHLLPGQFVTGRFDLLDMYNNGLKQKDKVKGEKTVYRWLETLEKGGYLTIKKTTKYSVVTINNWDIYQDIDQQMTNKRPTNDQQMTTNKNVKNVKNEKKKDISSQIKNLRERYSLDQLNAIDDYLEMIRHTRTSAKISESVVLKMYQDWDKYPAICVEYGVTTHTNNPAYHSRKENYTLGIIRNTKSDEAAQRIKQVGLSKQPVMDPRDWDIAFNKAFKKWCDEGNDSDAFKFEG